MLLARAASLGGSSGRPTTAGPFPCPFASSASRNTSGLMISAVATTLIRRLSRATASRPGGGVCGHRGLVATPAAAASFDAGVHSPFDPAAPLSKNFDPTRERDIYAWWESRGLFDPDHPAHLAARSARAAADGGKSPPSYTVPMPPPNVTGKLHMGHAMFVTLQDVATRFHRARGREALWLPGTDHAGIATQMVVERRIRERGDDPRAVGRDAFLAEAWQWRDEYGGAITQQLRRLGASCDWSRERFTLDDGLSAAVAEAFLRLHERGLVYRGARMINWSPSLQTAVSDIEVDFTTEQGKLYFFRYPVENPGPDDPPHLDVATTRPETILGDTAVAVAPGDPRFAALVGKRCVVPLTNPPRSVPIVADEQVDPEFGTGALKITPAHDANDFEVGNRHNLERLCVMEKDATMSASAGPRYAGLDRFDCRKRVWEDLQEAGLAIKADEYENRVPRSQRGGEIVEPMLSEQWFVEMAPLAKPALEAVEDGRIRIVPERFELTYRQWLEEPRDWCVSRQLWWGHRIPVWYVHASQAEADAALADPLREGRTDVWVVARNEAEARTKAEAEHGVDVGLAQEVDVLDTWFSSGLWPFSTVGWPGASVDGGADPAAFAPADPSSDLARFFPAALMETGHDILFFWVARMIMMSLALTGKAPFDTVYLHGLVRDDKGRKMSKSLGNVVDPVDVINDVGTDALRYALATGTAPGQDLNLNLEKVVSARNFTNKMWNVGKFLEFSLAQAEANDDAPSRADRLVRAAQTPARLLAGDLPLAEAWVVSSLHATVDRATEALEGLKYGEAGRLLQEWTWGELADWYVEAAKDRLYGDDAVAREACLDTLCYVVDTVLRLLHPLAPFVTEELWQSLFATAVATAATDGPTPALLSQPWPVTGAPRDAAAEARFEIFRDAVGAVRNARAEYNVDLGKRLSGVRLVGADLAASVAGEEGLFQLLAKVEFAPSNDTVATNGSDQTATLVVRPGMELTLPLDALFDRDKERSRLEGQRKKLDKEAGALRSRLGSKGFVDKAPVAVLEKTRGELADIEAKLASVDEKLAAL